MSNTNGHWLKIELTNKKDGTNTLIKWADADPLFALNDKLSMASNTTNIDTKIDTAEIDK